MNLKLIGGLAALGVGWWFLRPVGSKMKLGDRVWTNTILAKDVFHQGGGLIPLTSQRRTIILITQDPSHGSGGFFGNIVGAEGVAEIPPDLKMLIPDDGLVGVDPKDVTRIDRMTSQGTLAPIYGSK